MKRAIGVAVAVALSMGIMTSTSASTPKLSSELLSVSQMPIGWSVYHQPASSGTGCLANILEPKGIKPTSKAQVAFKDNGHSSLLDEAVATYSNATTTYKKIVATLSACKRVSRTSGGIKATGTVGQMSFPHYGNASAAFSVSIVAQGTAIGDDLLIVRKGNVIMGIEEADGPTVDVSQFQSFIVKALAKVK